jgi:DNA polymerase-3 subunit alpha
MTSEFIHLHNHSDYSLLDGAQTVPTLVETVGDLGMEAVGLTEHGNMFSVVPFYQQARKAGLKPIIGCEIYVAQGSRFDKKPKAHGGWGNNHLVLLAQNYTGYKNLMKLVTFGYLEGFYYRPRVDKELLREYGEGLICLSGCLKGEVPERMLKGDQAGAKAAALEYAELFPSRYYLEIQDHGLPAEKTNIENMRRLAKELDLPLVATNDSHYALRNHAEAHDIHICLGTGKERDDPNRLRYATPEFYFKSQDEMYTLFKEVPEALENSHAIAEQIDLVLPLGELHLPDFPIPQEEANQDPNEYLAQLSRQGVQERYGELTPELEQRLQYELSVIKKMGFAGYFLITRDFVQYARDQHIPVGPGRGSAAGSLVSYALGITTIDPLKHNLLFERFLNPERVTLPDIDIDFCYERRGEVIDYIKERYGEKSVSQIITFGKMKARQVVRDVGRVLGYSFGETDRLAKMIPTGVHVTLKSAMEQNPELKRAAEGPYRELMEHSLVLEGMNRHASIHAAGVVIAPGELTDFVPLYKSSQGDITTQYDMKGLEALGLLKMDFLGLRNLTVIDHTVKLLQSRGVEVDMDAISLDDPEVYRLFAKGLTIGVFQFESSGMREFLKKLKPTQIEDLIAMNALYRPGPIAHIDDFIKRKHGRKKIEYVHPALEPILKETYGIIVYQEQVMQIAHEIANFTLAEADLMRRAMGKKIKSLMAEQKVKFIQGAEKGGISHRQAEKIYALIEKFAEYGFNKSHSTAYAYIAYQTAWLKAHYPTEFMAANLTSEMSDSDRVVILINECQKLKIKVIPPNINLSHIHFTPQNDGTIVFGLNAVKNVGSKALEYILKARDVGGPFKNIFDFTSRVDLRAVNKKVLESLIMAGAMDELEGTRAQQYAAVDMALRFGQQVQDRKRQNQVDLFGDSGGTNHLTMIPELPKVPDWSEAEMLAREKEVLGLYLTGHPLLKYSADLETFSTFDFSDDMEVNSRDSLRIGGLVQNLKRRFDRNNREMAFFTLECLGGHADVVAFSDVFNRYQDYLKTDSVVFVTGKPSNNSDFSDLKLIAEEIVPLEKARDHFSKRVNIRVDQERLKPHDVDELFDLSRQFQGSCRLMFHLTTPTGREQRILAHNIRVSSRREFLAQLQERFGKKNVWIE